MNSATSANLHVSFTRYTSTPIAPQENIKDVARAQLEEELRDAVDHADKMKLKAANLR